MRFGCHPYSVSHCRYPAPASDLSSVWVIWQVIGHQSQVTDNRREVQLKGSKVRMTIRRSTHNSKLGKTPTLVPPQPGPHFDSHPDPRPDLHLILILILNLISRKDDPQGQDQKWGFNVRTRGNDQSWIGVDQSDHQGQDRK